VLSIVQMYETGPLPPGAIEICALKAILTVVPQAIAPKLFGFIVIATPASCMGMLVPLGVTEDTGEALVGVPVALEAGGVREPVPDCDGVVKHALRPKPISVTSKSASSKRLSIVTPWLR